MSAPAPALFGWVEEALASLGRVTLRRMMGGATLYLDGIVFAIIADDLLWLKADSASDAKWDAAGATRFTYDFGHGRQGTMNYRAAPDDCYDDADALARWARLALAAGHRATAAKRPRRPLDDSDLEPS